MALYQRNCIWSVGAQNFTGRQEGGGSQGSCTCLQNKARMTKVTIAQGKILQFRNEAKTMLVKYILTRNKLKTEREHIHEVKSNYRLSPRSFSLTYITYPGQQSSGHPGKSSHSAHLKQQ